MEKNAINEAIGARLHTIRKDLLQYTLREMADDIGMDYSWYAKAEKGYMKMMGYDRLIRISELAGINLHWLITGYGPMKLTAAQRRKH